MRTGQLVLVAVAAVLAASPHIPAAAARAAGPATVTLAQKAPFGGYLTDSTGRALYLFTADRNHASACDGACAAAWPPLTVTGTPTAGEGVKASMLGVVPRKSGAKQVTYDGKPLYYFKGDSAAGSTAGEGIDHFGGEWYLLSPKGGKIDDD
ncbi:MAG TPA: hypothetical protein VIJ55_14225 [Acetobacteraceae bacterium]